MDPAELLDLGFAAGIAIYFIREYQKSEKKRSADSQKFQESLTELVCKFNKTTDKSTRALESALDFIKSQRINNDG